MTRYTKKFNMSVSPSSLVPAIEEYLDSKGFSQTLYKGSVVWKKGMGLITCPQYFILTYGDQIITVEAFLRLALLPGIFVGEMDTDGFIAAVPKNMLRESINSLERFLKSL